MTPRLARIAPGTLAGLTALEVDAIALLLGAEREQPAGVAGLVDWRLDGRLARLVRDRRFEGALGEQLLTLGGGGLGPARVFVFGSDGPREEVRAAAVRALVEAGVESVALAPAPGEEVVGAALAWLRALADGGAAFASVVLLDAEGALSAELERVAEGAERAGWPLAAARAIS